MRSGSGAVLLVGFALVVMLLSVASVVTPPSMLIKQDPSQDFADYASSIKEMIHSYNSLRGTHTEKSNYVINSIATLSKQYLVNGINSTVLVSIIGAWGSKMWSITPSGATNLSSESDDLSQLGISPSSLEGSDTILVWYALASIDNSSYFVGFASNDRSVEQSMHPAPNENTPGQILLPSFCTIPDGVCFIGSPWSWLQFPSPSAFLILNPNQVSVDAIMSYSGSGTVKNLMIRVFEFPGDNGLVDVKVYKWDKESNTITFSLDPAVIIIKKTLNIGSIKIKVGHKYNVGVSTVLLKYGGSGGKIGSFHIEGSNIKPKDVPVYWNDIKDCIKAISRGLKNLRVIGGHSSPEGG